ncbi:MAG: GH92 family glycosyl hydrolase [Candidatus Cryptobacteroides sp.]
MKTKKTALFLLSALISLTAIAKEPAEYVDMFIGTSNSRWMLGPYAQRPFGMVQLGPDNQGNVWMGGYEWSISNISGFSHIHAWTMGGVMIMPSTTDLATGNPSTDSPYQGANAGYHSRILKETETARPGYYSAYLYDARTLAEMTATTRCGIHRYTFPECETSRILVDLQFPTEWDYGFTVKKAEITSINRSEVEGYAECQSGPWSWWNEYKMHFVLRFSREFDTMNGWNGGRIVENISTMAGSGDTGAYFTFNTEEGEAITVCCGISLVSIEQARLNLEEEAGRFGYDFDRIATDAYDEWNSLLGRIRIEGGSEEDKTKFYTNLYRAYAGKQTWSDVNGKYIDAMENERTIPKGAMYGGDAFWNSYWNLNGLWSLVTPEIIDNWVETQLEMFRHTGWTGKGPTGIEYSGIMEGSHETALMVSAYHKGIRKDGEEIYKAVLKNVTEPGIDHPGGGNAGNPLLDIYIKYGYMPREYGVISKTLDYAYDDWCVAMMAEAVGDRKTAKMLKQRSGNWRNAFNPATGYVTMRDKQGNWDPDFDRFSNKGFIEGNSWQYSWYVPHNIAGIVEMLGRDEFNRRLEEGFEKSVKHNFAAHVFDRTMGQSAEFYINHGNEVNMCTPFLFNYSGKPWLAQKWSRSILDKFYGSTPYHGWDGDEDEGQMSAWFVMSAMGLFEMDGGCSPDPVFDISSPLFSKVTISLDGRYYTGKEFTINAIGNSDKNIYIQEAYLNGKKLSSPKLRFNDVVRGGELTLVMGDSPKEWK